jgi:hypothetical protein
MNPLKLNKKYENSQAVEKITFDFTVPGDLERFLEKREEIQLNNIKFRGQDNLCKKFVPHYKDEHRHELRAFEFNNYINDISKSRVKIADVYIYFIRGVRRGENYCKSDGSDLPYNRFMDNNGYIHTLSPGPDCSST